MPAPAHVPPALIADVDIYALPGAGQDFHGAWHALQASLPHNLVWTPRNGGHWIALRGQDVMDLFADHARFSSCRNVLPATNPSPSAAP